MKWLTRFLWRQLRYCLAAGGFFAGGYIIQQYFHQYWAVGSVMLFIAVIIGIAWILSFFSSDTWSSDSYDSGKRRENYSEVQQREFEEDMHRFQREQEDRHA